MYKIMNKIQSKPLIFTALHSYNSIVFIAKYRILWCISTSVKDELVSLSSLLLQVVVLTSFILSVIQN